MTNALTPKELSKIKDAYGDESDVKRHLWEEDGLKEACAATRKLLGHVDALETRIEATRQTLVSAAYAMDDGNGDRELIPPDDVGKWLASIGDVLKGNSDPINLFDDMEEI